MNNKYLFIIWDKALFARNKIISDLEKSFNIVNNFYIEWTKDNFKVNLKSFYGHKISDVEDKIKCIGLNKFNLIIVEDNNPEFVEIDTHDGKQKVNNNIYKKKLLYRKWTGGSFRIHCTCNEDEFNHDICVLFGSNYQEQIKNVKKEDIIKLDTKTAIGFNNQDDMYNCLKLFGNNVVVDNRILFAQNRLDIERFIQSLSIKVYGEDEGDLPKGMFKLLNDNKINDFLKLNNYDKFLENRNNIDPNIELFFKKYNFEIPTKQNSLRISNITIFNKIKRSIKYIIARYKYGKE